jgi:hypothetical protein
VSCFQDLATLTEIFALGKLLRSLLAAP